VVLDDVGRVDISGFDSTNAPAHQPMLLFRNVIGALLNGSRISSPAEVFLSVLGEKSAAIALRGNDLRLARKVVQLSSEVPRAAVWVELDGTSSPAAERAGRAGGTTAPP